jgi:hypothetical protein
VSIPIVYFDPHEEVPRTASFRTYGLTSGRTSTQASPVSLRFGFEYDRDLLLVLQDGTLMVRGKPATDEEAGAALREFARARGRIHARAVDWKDET